MNYFLNQNSPIIQNKDKIFQTVADSPQFKNLSQEEKTRMSLFLGYFDANGDGVIDEAESSGMANCMSIFDRFDQMTNGALSQNPDLKMALMEKFDIDNDGVIDDTEVALLNFAINSGMINPIIANLQMPGGLGSNIPMQKGSTYAPGVGGQMARYMDGLQSYTPPRSNKDELDDVEKQIKEKESELTALKEQIQNDVDKKEKEIDELLNEKVKNDDALKKKKDDKQNEINDNRAQIAQKEKEIDSKKSEISKFEADIARLEAHKGAIPEGNTPEAKAANDAKRNELDKQIQTLKAQKQEAEEKLESLNEEKTKLEHRAQELEAEQKVIEAEIIGNDEELKGKVDALREDINKIKTDKDTQGKIESLESELKTLRAERLQKSEKQGKIEGGELEFDVAFSEKMSPYQQQEAERFKQHYLANQERYESVAQKTGVPAKLIAALHWRESEGNFNTYMHNGDPLGRPTVHVPRGKYFTDWESSAVDALKERNKCGLSADSTNTSAMLEYAERYNGLGYRKKGCVSPYVWGGTDRYVSGRYVADGRFDPTSVDKRIGVAMMLKTLNGIG